jgi:hypothetical protein
LPHSTWISFRSPSIEVTFRRQTSPMRSVSLELAAQGWRVYVAWECSLQSGTRAKATAEHIARPAPTIILSGNRPVLSPGVVKHALEAFGGYPVSRLPDLLDGKLVMRA